MNSFSAASSSSALEPFLARNDFVRHRQPPVGRDACRVGPPSPAAQPGQPGGFELDFGERRSRPAAPRAGWRSASAKARMEGAHQHVHPDHSIRGNASCAAEQNISCGPPPRTPVSSAMMRSHRRAARHTQSAAPRTTAAGHSSRVPIVCVVMAFHLRLVPEPEVRAHRAASSITTSGPSGTRIIELPVVLDPEVRIRTCGKCRRTRNRTTGCREIDWQRLSKGESYKRGGIPMDSLITAAARALARVIPSAP